MSKSESRIDDDAGSLLDERARARLFASLTACHCCGSPVIGERLELAQLSRSRSQPSPMRA